MIQNEGILQSVNSNTLLLLEGEQTSIGAYVARWKGLGLTVRLLRGRQMAVESNLFSECAAALQFPLHFGYNREAFSECLGDLEDVPVGGGIVLVISEPDKVLLNASAESTAWFLRTSVEAALEWARPIQQGEWWDRPAVPFHVVFAGDARSIAVAEKRWRGIGVQITTLG